MESLYLYLYVYRMLKSVVKLRDNVLRDSACSASERCYGMMIMMMMMLMMVTTQAVRAKWRLLMTSRQFVCLVPLLVFNGLEQGFVYAVYNKVDSFRFHF